MTQTTAITVNVVLGLGLVGALALVVRIAKRIHLVRPLETLHPSKPLRLAVVQQRDDDPELARVA